MGTGIIMKIRSGLVYNMFVGIASFLISLLVGAISVGMLLYVIGTTMTIAQQNGNHLLLVICVAWAMLSASVSITVGSMFYDTYSREWWQ